MATRTSQRATKAVKFVDSAESEGEDFEKVSSTQMKTEAKKSRGRPPNSRRTRTTDDDDEWNAANEQIDDNEDDDDDDNDDDEENVNQTGRDVTKKFHANRATDSVYDFG